jgi:hypothetical protein
VITALLVIEQHGRQSLPHVPLYIVSQHGQQDVSADPVRRAMVNRADVQVDALQAAKGALHGRIYGFRRKSGNSETSGADERDQPRIF